MWASSALALPASMVTGEYTSQPIGHYDFCERNPVECRIEIADQGPLHMSRETWQLIVDINVAVNEAITPMDDLSIYGIEEFWDYPVNVGDCEDYVLSKRSALIRQGVSAGALRIAYTHTSRGEPHAVLVVRTSEGDYVLDNLNNTVKTLRASGYNIRSMSSPNPTRWTTG